MDLASVWLVFLQIKSLSTRLLLHWRPWEPNKTVKLSLNSPFKPAIVFSLFRDFYWREGAETYLRNIR